MISSKITYRYAKALLDLAISENLMDECLADMKLLEKVCKENSRIIIICKANHLGWCLTSCQKNYNQKSK